MNGFLDIYTILFLVVAVVIFMRLRSVLGRRTGHERPPFDPYTRPEGPAGDAATNGRDKVVQLPKRSDKPAREAEKPDRWKGFAKPGSSLARTLSGIAEIDPRFDPRKFLDGATTAYEMIVTAFAEGDRRTLKNLLARDVFDGFAAAIADRESRGETMESRFVSIDKAEITGAELKGKSAQITLRFVSQLISVTRNRNGDVVEGSADSVADVTDIWTFARDVGARDPNWKLIATEAPTA